MPASNSHRYVAWFLFLGISAAYLLMATKFPHAYIVATYEDLIGEWCQVFLFATTMLLAARMAIISPRFRLYFGLLALACFYVAGEEISWGQRLFDIPTPEFFAEHNLQGETNLHNLFTGPISTPTKRALEYIIAAGLVGYSLIYPWLLQLRVRLALWLEGKGLAAPPLYLSPFFILSAVLELQLFHFNEAEVAEIMIPLALGIMTLVYLLSLRYGVEIHDNRRWEKVHSRRLATQTALLFIFVLCLAVGTTLGCYSTPRLRAEIQDRYLNGIEKFAGRYMRYEQWEIATGLYLQIQQEEPDNSLVRRRLYECYEELGKMEDAQLQLGKAIETDLLLLASQPDSISTNISLVESYEMAGDYEKMHRHLQQAHDLGLVQKTEDPFDSDAAYLMGTVYTLQGNYVDAMLEFKRAVTLQPESLQYKKALLATLRVLQEKGADV